MVLAACGIYGFVSHAVTRRTLEIGVRMALGASRGEVVGLVVADVSVMVGIGSVVLGDPCRDQGEEVSYWLTTILEAREWT